MKVAARLYMRHECRDQRYAIPKEAPKSEIEGLLTYHIHKVPDDRRRVIVLHHREEQAYVDNVVFAFEVLRNGLVNVKHLQ